MLKAMICLNVLFSIIYFFVIYKSSGEIEFCVCSFSPKRYAVVYVAGLDIVLARMSMFDLYNLIYFCAGIDGVVVSIYAHT